MLYTHWRDDERDLIGQFGSFEESYDAKIHEISTNKLQYEKIDEYENVLETVESDRLSTTIHPEAQHQE